MFWVDSEYDRERASNGVSRFAEYVRPRRPAFQEMVEDGEQSGSFAALAWGTATPPVMAPGYVAWHPRVLSATAEHDDWAGDLLLTVELVSALPEQVIRAARQQWHGWTYEACWDAYESPPLRRRVRDRALLPTLTAQILVPAAELPTPALTPQMSSKLLWQFADNAVRVICAHLNTQLAPIVEALDGGTR